MATTTSSSASSNLGSGLDIYAWRSELVWRDVPLKAFTSRLQARPDRAGLVLTTPETSDEANGQAAASRSTTGARPNFEEVIVWANDEPCCTQVDIDRILGLSPKIVTFTVLQCRVRERYPLQVKSIDKHRREELLSVVVQSWLAGRWAQVFIRDQLRIQDVGSLNNNSKKKTKKNSNSNSILTQVTQAQLVPTGMQPIPIGELYMYTTLNTDEIISGCEANPKTATRKVYIGGNAKDFRFHFVNCNTIVVVQTQTLFNEKIQVGDVLVRVNKRSAPRNHLKVCGIKDGGVHPHAFKLSDGFVSLHLRRDTQAFRFFANQHFVKCTPGVAALNARAPLQTHDVDKTTSTRLTQTSQTSGKAQPTALSTYSSASAAIDLTDLTDLTSDDDDTPTPAGNSSISDTCTSTVASRPKTRAANSNIARFAIGDPVMTSMGLGHVCEYIKPSRLPRPAKRSAATSAAKSASTFSSDEAIAYTLSHEISENIANGDRVTTPTRSGRQSKRPRKYGNPDMSTQTTRSGLLLSSLPPMATAQIVEIDGDASSSTPLAIAEILPGNDEAYSITLTNAVKHAQGQYFAAGMTYDHTLSAAKEKFAEEIKAERKLIETMNGGTDASAQSLSTADDVLPVDDDAVLSLHDVIVAEEQEQATDLSNEPGHTPMEVPDEKAKTAVEQENESGGLLIDGDALAYILDLQKSEKAAIATAVTAAVEVTTAATAAIATTTTAATTVSATSATAAATLTPTTAIRNGNIKKRKIVDVNAPPSVAVTTPSAAVEVDEILPARYCVALHWGSFPLMNAKNTTTRLVGQWAKVINVSGKGGIGQFKFREAEPVLGFFCASEIQDAASIAFVEARGVSSKPSPSQTNAQNESTDVDNDTTMTISNRTNKNKNSRKRFCRPRRAQTFRLTMGELGRLWPDQYLNDSLVDFYLQFLYSQLDKVNRNYKGLSINSYMGNRHMDNAHNGHIDNGDRNGYISNDNGHNGRAATEQHHQQQRQLEHGVDVNDLQKRVHIFSSYLFKKLSLSRSFADVQSWAGEVDIVSKQYLLVPIAEHHHWTLAVVCNPWALGAHLLEKEKVFNDTKRTKESSMHTGNVQSGAGAGADADVDVIGDAAIGNATDTCASAAGTTTGVEADINVDAGLIGNATNDIIVGGGVVVASSTVMDVDGIASAPVAASTPTGRRRKRGLENVNGSVQVDNDDGVVLLSGTNGAIGGGSRSSREVGGVVVNTDTVDMASVHFVPSPAPVFNKTPVAKSRMVDNNGKAGDNRTGNGSVKEQVMDEVVGEIGVDGDEIPKVATIDVEEVMLPPCIFFLDSLKSHKLQHIAKLIRFYFEHEWKRRLGADHPGTVDFEINAKNLPAISLQGPLQVNETDCGVYVLESAERILPDLDAMFSEARKVYATSLAAHHMNVSGYNKKEQPKLIDAVKRVANKRWTKDWFSSADVVFKRRAIIELMEHMRHVAESARTSTK